MPTPQSIEAVLRLIASNGECSPMALIAALKAQGIDESAAKDAISFLINDHQVEMTENRQLRALEFAA